MSSNLSRDHKRIFWLGCLSGLGFAAGLVLVCFAYEFSGLRDTLDEYGGEIPAITKLVTNPVYLRAMPIAVLAVVILGNLWVKRPRLLFALIATTTALASIAVVVGYWGATLPMRQLSDDIAF